MLPTRVQIRQHSLCYFGKALSSLQLQNKTLLAKDARSAPKLILIKMRRAAGRLKVSYTTVQRLPAPSNRNRAVQDNLPGIGSQQESPKPGAPECAVLGTRFRAIMFFLLSSDWSTSDFRLAGKAATFGDLEEQPSQESTCEATQSDVCNICIRLRYDLHATEYSGQSLEWCKALLACPGLERRFRGRRSSAQLYLRSCFDAPLALSVASWRRAIPVGRLGL